MIKINIRIIKWIYNNAPRSWSHKDYILYIQLFWFPGTLMFTFDELWVSLGTSIFGKSSSAANNARSRLSSRLSFRFSWLWKNSIHKNEKLSIWKVKLKSFNYWCLETKTCLPKTFCGPVFQKCSEVLSKSCHIPWFMSIKTKFVICTRNGLAEKFALKPNWYL